MSRLRLMPVELFTTGSRLAGEIETHHIHIRDVLNDATKGYLIVHRASLASLLNLKAPPVSSQETRINKDAIILAIPRKVRGTTAMLKQRILHSRLGRNEYRVLLEVYPFQVVGNLHVIGSFDVQEAIFKLDETFISLSRATVTYLPVPSVAFAVQEIVVNRDYGQILCANPSLS